MRYTKRRLANVVQVPATLRTLMVLSLVMIASTPVASGRPAYDRRQPSPGLPLNHHHQGDAVSHHHRTPIHVVVSPDVALMDSNTEQVRVTCLASVDDVNGSVGSSEVSENGRYATVDELPYVTFYWMIVEHTSMPLSSSIPGITVRHHRSASNSLHVINESTLTAGRSPKRRRQRNRNDSGADKRRNSNVDDADVAVDSPEVVTSNTSSTLVVDERFYHVLHWGDNKFACKAHTLSGRRTTGFFVIRKI